MPDQLVKLRLILKVETPNGYYLTSPEDMKSGEWVPKRLVRITDDPTLGVASMGRRYPSRCMATMPTYLAERKGWLPAKTRGAP